MIVDDAPVDQGFFDQREIQLKKYRPMRNCGHLFLFSLPGLFVAADAGVRARRDQRRLSWCRAFVLSVNAWFSCPRVSREGVPCPQTNHHPLDGGA